MLTQITTDVLANSSVTSDIIANSAVTTTKIANGAITGSTIANNSIDGSKIALGSDAKGDVMYYNGSNWARLPAGVDGQVLTTQGPNANPAWNDLPDWGGTETAAANGYITFPSGIKLEWGKSASIPANTTDVVTFPSAFATSVYSVTVTEAGTANLTSTGTITVSNANVTAFTIENGTDNARNFYWQAIGK